MRTLVLKGILAKDSAGQYPVAKPQQADLVIAFRLKLNGGYMAVQRTPDGKSLMVWTPKGTYRLALVEGSTSHYYGMCGNTRVTVKVKKIVAHMIF